MGKKSVKSIIVQGNVYRDFNTCHPRIHQPSARQDDPKHRFQQEGCREVQQQDNQRGERVPETPPALYGPVNTCGSYALVE